MKRQRSRNRGGGGSGGKPQQNANRAFESNGPDGVKIRGAAQHVFEKYQQLARDALTAGDRVLAESYQQHAEHYFRVLRAVQPNRPASDIIGRDAFASGFDIDFEDESGGNEAEAPAENGEGENDRSESREWRQEGRRDERPRDDRQQQNDRQQRDRNFNRDDRPRDNGNYSRDDRPAREDRNYNRDDRPQQNDRQQQNDRPQQQNDRQSRDRNFNRDDRPRDDRPREERQREDRPREDRQRDERPRYDRGDRAERSDPLAVVEPRASPLTAEAEPISSPVLRSHDGGVSHAPAFLQQQPRPEPAADAGEAAPKPKRRRAPRAAADKAADATPSDIVSSEDA
jgi:hypothetical protein